MRLIRFAVILSIAGAAIFFALGRLPAPQLPSLAARTGPSLQSAAAWGYQLQGARAGLIPPEIDLIVIDHARDASATDLLSAADVEAFRARPGAAPRIVLAYMSIGEAENYRFYWWKPWVSKALFGLLRPGWLSRENKEWKGNYLVRYWQPGWQKLIFNPAPSRLDALREMSGSRPRPYIDQILEAGFDGVYLDRVDAFNEWEKTRKTAEADMNAFVINLSAYAKQRKPGFLVMPQNGEELVRSADYRRAIDGIAKEDLLFGVDAPERENKPEDIKRTIDHLTSVRSELGPVFVVEYISAPGKRLMAQQRAAELGYTLTFAERALNTPPVSFPKLPNLTPPAAAARAPAAQQPQQ